MARYGRARIKLVIFFSQQEKCQPAWSPFPALILKPTHLPGPAAGSAHASSPVTPPDGWCYGLDVCAPQLICRSPKPQCCSVWGWAFRRWLGWGEAMIGQSSHDGISILIRKDTRKRPLCIKRRSCEQSQEKRPQNDTYLASTLIFNFLASKCVKNKFALLKPPSLWNSVPAAWDDQHRWGGRFEGWSREEGENWFSGQRIQDLIS